jgi:threonine dehydrogenase-like Zn-dependent dehydrogenase
VEIRAEKLPLPGSGQLLVESRFGALSRGTEALVFRGEVPESEYQRMRCPHQEGDFPGPLKYGYSSVGRVEEGPAEWLGRHVFCLYPHQTHYVVDASAAVRVPESVPPDRAVLGANMETALNALWDARVMLGDRVGVVGAGTLGCLCAYLCGRVPAVDVELVEVMPERAPTADALGVRLRHPDEASAERDIVFHASGTEAGLRTALGLAGSGGRVIELSWFGSREVTLKLGEAFHVRRLSLESSQVGTVSPNARRRFGYTERLGLALELCADPALDSLFSGESAFSDLPGEYRAALEASSTLCHRVRYDS